MVSKEDSNNKFKSTIESAVTILGVIVFAFVVMFLCQKAMAKDTGHEQEITIGTNSAEISFYNADYDGAISGYESMQNNEEWPLSKVKEAEVYSVKGEYAASNRLLLEAYDTRNKLIRKNGIEKYENEDKELGNLIIFTALMNGNNEKALEYGEIFLLDDGNSKQLDKLMFTVYLANDKKDEAQKILDNIEYDKNSAYDLAEVAYMDMIMGNYSKGIENLSQAYGINKDEPKIYDVLANVMTNDSKKLVEELKGLSKNDSKALSYKVFLIKCYSIDGSKTKDAQKLLDDVKNEDLGGSVFKTIAADVYRNAGEIDKYNETIQNIVDIEEKNSFEYYITARYYYENKNYSDAVKNAKYSIIEDREYSNTYADLMPEALIAAKESERAGSYYRTALYHEPFNYVTIIKLADYTTKIQQDADKALKYYTLASKIDSDNSVIYYDMGVCKLTLDKKDEGIALLEKAIKLNGNTPKYYRKLAAVHLQSKENDKAIKLIRKAYEINENDIETLNAAGYYYMSVNEIDRAMTNFKSAYQDMNDGTDLNIKNIITKNYEKAKEYSDNKNRWTKSAIEDFKLTD